MRNDRDANPALLGSSPAIHALRHAIAQAAADATVLLIGPAGAGKSLAAAALHAERIRVGATAVDARLVIWRPVSTSPDAVREAFARALADADGGTLAIDRVEALTPTAQAALAAAIDARGEGEATRLIGMVRAQAWAGPELEPALADAFGGFAIEVPGLDHRIEDIPELIAAFARERADGGAPVRFAPRARGRIVGARWPRHVRELRAFVLRAVRGQPAGAVVDEQAVCALLAARLSCPDPAEPAGEIDLDALIAAFELTHIRAALARSAGVVAEAARLLRLRRTTLIDRMRRHGLTRGSDGAGAVVAAGARAAERAAARRVEAGARGAHCEAAGAPLPAGDYA